MEAGTPHDAGRPVVVEDVLGAGTIEELSALLGPFVPDLADRDVLPAMWHLACLLPVWPQSDIGPDGHPRSGLPAPPDAGRRRMFAGARVDLRSPLRIGSPAVRRSEVVGSSESVGRSGRLTFVTLRHELSQDGRVCIIDEQDIVYREPAGVSVGRGVPVPTPEEPAQVEREFVVDPVVLFRFSAVTRNAHRIHYDVPYAATEGYGDLVVHGPLQAVLMATALQQVTGPLDGRRVSYRLTAPAVGPQRLRIRAGLGDLPWAEVRDAGAIMTATMTVDGVA